MKPERSSLYGKLFLSTTLSIVLSLLLTSAILYVNFERIALEGVYASDRESLTQTARGVDSLTGMAVTLASQIYSDLSVARLMYYPEPGTEDLRTADMQLTNYRLSIPFIDSVYVYNGKARVFYVNSIVNRNESREAIQGRANFDDPDAIALIESYGEYRPYRPIPRLYTLRGNEGTVRRYYSFLMYDAFTSGEIDHAVIVNFSQEWVANFMSGDSAANDSIAFILDGDGRVISDSPLYPMLKDLSTAGYIQKILASEGPGSAMEIVEGERRLVSFTAPDRMGWRYVRLTPRSTVLREITRMNRITLLAAALLATLGLIASWFLARRLYVPIDTLVTALKRLSQEEKRNIRLLRQVFFRDLFLGRTIYDGQTVALKLEELGTAFYAAGYYAVVLARIDRYPAFSRENTIVDQGLAKAAMMELCAEALAGEMNHVELDMGTDGVAAVLNSLDRPRDLDPDSLEARLVSFRDRVTADLGFSVSITVSNVAPGIENLRELYEETLEASLYRLYRGHGCIIHAREVQSLSSGDAAELFPYPVNLEKTMTAALLAGKVPEAKDAFSRIVATTNNRPVSAFNLTLSRLVFAVEEAVSTVRKYGDIEGEESVSISIAALNSAETLAEITSFFFNIFDRVGSVLADRKSNRGEHAVEKINAHIESGYMRQDLYIDSIAEYMDKSPTYISHLYKRRTGITILDKIVAVRMARAKELLLSTELSAAEISERTGFSSSSYFFKVFRKVNGVTPNEFRGREE